MCKNQERFYLTPLSFRRLRPTSGLHPVGGSCRRHWLGNPDRCCCCCCYELSLPIYIQI